MNWDAVGAFGFLGKVPHSTPYQTFQWDMARDQSHLGQGRNPEVYYQYAKGFVQDAIAGDRPFFLMANSHDPHRPFYGNDKPEWYSELNPPAVPPSRIFAPEEVIVPGFLPDIPDVRLEIAEYYNSVRRCDDTVGRLLDVLDEMGVAENTLVMLIDDPNYADEIQGLRNALEEWMADTDDPALNAFRGRASRQALDDLMDHLADTIGSVRTNR
ncbi:MAG: sulfatase-like hydrolase/transferase [Gemmatimonadota bacterium]|nr:sulfatase-like hydrolase/transferase [Gemmatimonadota bacterium]